jgi:hypothetical protein
VRAGRFRRERAVLPRRPVPRCRGGCAGPEVGERPGPGRSGRGRSEKCCHGSSIRSAASRRTGEGLPRCAAFEAGCRSRREGRWAPGRLGLTGTGDTRAPERRHTALGGEVHLASPSGSRSVGAARRPFKMTGRINSCQAGSVAGTPQFGHREAASPRAGDRPADSGRDLHGEAPVRLWAHAVGACPHPWPAGRRGGPGRPGPRDRGTPCSIRPGEILPPGSTLGRPRRAGHRSDDLPGPRRGSGAVRGKGGPPRAQVSGPGSWRSRPSARPRSSPWSAASPHGGPWHTSHSTDAAVGAPGDRGAGNRASARSAYGCRHPFAPRRTQS